MNIKITLSLILIYLSGFAFAQIESYPTFEFTYDDFGNRTKRTYIIWEPPGQGQTSMRGNGGGNNIEQYNTRNDIEKEREGKEIIPITYDARIDKRNITIHPNPTSGMLKLEISDISDINESQILISDLTGKVLYNQEITSKQMDFNLGSQPSGAYIMAIRINGVSKEWKIIKME